MPRSILEELAVMLIQEFAKEKDEEQWKFFFPVLFERCRWGAN